MLDLRYREAWLAGAFWLAVLIAVGSLLPGPVVATVHLWDKLEHGSAYAALTLWLAGLEPRSRAWRPALMSVACGALLELAQGTLTATRLFDPADLVANASGAAVGLLIAWFGAAGWSARVEAWLAAREGG